MQFQSKIHGKIAAATLVAGTVLATAALAQFGGQPAPNAPGNPFGAAPSPRGGGPFGPGHSPFAVGTVSAVNAAAGTITLTPMFGEASGQTVKVTGDTQISAQKAATVADLKVGDAVQVRGVPTGITATAITAGDSADLGMGGPLGMMPGPGGSAGQGAASAQATGKISSLSPLTVAVSDTVSVVLKTAPEVRVTKNVTETLSDIKAGDRIMANGQSGDDGILTASKIHLNLDYGFGRPPAPRPMPRAPMPPGQ